MAIKDYFTEDRANDLATATADLESAKMELQMHADAFQKASEKVQMLKNLVDLLQMRVSNNEV